MSEYKVTHDDLKAFDALIQAQDSYYAIRDLHPVDPETGMPALPEGYFWRVYKEFGSNYVGLYYNDVQVSEYEGLFYFITKKKTVKTKTKVRKIEDYHINKSVSDPVAGITEAATWLLRMLPDHLKKEVNPVSYAAYYGDYPPKNLLTADEG